MFADGLAAARRIAPTALVIVAAGAVGCDDAEERVAEAERALDARLVDVREEESQMRDALRTAPELRSGCDVLPDRELDINVWEPGESASTARLELFTEKAAELRRQAPSLSEAGLAQWLGRLVDPAWHRYELVVLTTEYRPARGGEIHGAFEGGSVTGRAVVWDHVDGAARCAADVSAVSSDELETMVPDPPASPDEMLGAVVRTERLIDRDLRNNLRSASIAALTRR